MRNYAKSSGKAVRNVRESTSTTAGLCTACFVRTMGHVEIVGALLVVLLRLWHGFSTAQRDDFASVGGWVLPITHRPYNNNEVFNSSLITIIKEVAL
jgi:hypothetical protein